MTGQIEHRRKILLILLVRAGAPGQHDPVETDAVRLRDIGMAEEIVVAGRAAAPSVRSDDQPHHRVIGKPGLVLIGEKLRNPYRSGQRQRLLRTGSRVRRCATGQTERGHRGEQRQNQIFFHFYLYLSIKIVY